MQLRFYNSLTRSKDIFTPLDAGHVRLYACGPTVYDVAHIGNFRMAVVFDVLNRLLRHVYPRVTYVSNITDVDDKIMIAASERGEDIVTLTQKYTKIYNDDLRSLKCELPDIQPRATDHIPQMIKLCEDLIARGHAYVAEGHVLFHVPSFPAYGGLSGRSRDDQIAGARVDVAPYKKDAADFVLWKPSTGEQVGWDSPFGRGRPGWHIECSAMAEAHLGLPFDIHGGGADLKFPHHENEIAQSCCAHGHTHDLSHFAKVWIHNGFLTVEGEKMSKSLGNFTTAQDLLAKGVKGEVIRYALLAGHYRQPLDWTQNGVHQAKAQLDKFYKLLHAQEVLEADIPHTVLEALADDLNTPKVIAELNALYNAGDAAGLKAAGALIGILQDNPRAWLGLDNQADGDADWITDLINARAAAKKAKDFAMADSIRAELLNQGIVIEDTKDGTLWRRG
jgi:cysteinyl-tRNA synthetase